MVDAVSVSTVSKAIALALTAGTIATKKDEVAPAIKDRHKALRRAVGKKSADILGELEEKVGSDDAARAALAKDLAEGLEKHGATKDRDVIMTARELLALIKVDDVARATVDSEMITEVEEALVKLSEVDVEGDNITKHDSTKTVKADAKAGDAKPKRAAPPSAPTSSLRFLEGEKPRIPPEEESKTELERSILPIHKRTDRFFMKLGVVAGIVVSTTLAIVLALRKSPDEAIESCMHGDAAKCWQVVAAQDAVDQGRSVSTEPLILLCNKHQDACACAGLAYVTAARSGASAGDCAGLQSATAMDPKWPCTCRKYNLWRAGQTATTHCGIPRCE